LATKKNSHECKCKNKCEGSGFFRKDLFDTFNIQSNNLTEVSKKAIKKEPNYVVFKTINSDGRLEIPQDLLVKSEWLENNRYLSFQKQKNNSFVMADMDVVAAGHIDFNLEVNGDRVKIPKTVFKMMGLPTAPGTKYEISYLEYEDLMKVRLVK
jgi:hypothetical protein